MIRFIKNLFSVFISLVIFASGFSVFASESVCFTAQDISTDNNRIFTLTISGKGTEALSAVTFDFNYNSDAIEFRDADALDENSTLKAYEEPGKLKLIFLNENGVDLSEGAELFTVDFKAENLTDSEKISFSVSDCVNSNIESFNASGGECTVSLTESTASSVSATKSIQDKGENSSASSGNSTSAKTYSAVTETDSINRENTDANISFQNSENAVQAEEQINNGENRESFLSVGEKSNTVRIFVAGAVIMCVFIAVCGIAYHIGRKSKTKDD